VVVKANPPYGKYFHLNNSINREIYKEFSAFLWGKYKLYLFVEFGHIEREKLLSYVIGLTGCVLVVEAYKK